MRRVTPSHPARNPSHPWVPFARLPVTNRVSPLHTSTNRPRSSRFTRDGEGQRAGYQRVTPGASRHTHTHFLPPTVGLRSHPRPNSSHGGYTSALRTRYPPPTERHRHIFSRPARGHPPWDRLAEGPSHLPLSAIPQTKYKYAERERHTATHHLWPAPGPSRRSTN